MGFGVVVGGWLVRVKGWKGVWNIRRWGLG